MRVLLRRLAVVAPLVLATVAAGAQPPQQANQLQLRARRDSLESELQRIAVVDRKVMVVMRDGLKMQADIYRP